jgi:hypothetical protein
MTDFPETDEIDEPHANVYIEICWTELLGGMKDRDLRTDEELEQNIRDTVLPPADFDEMINRSVKVKTEVNKGGSDE